MPVSLSSTADYTTAIWTRTEEESTLIELLQLSKQEVSALRTKYQHPQAWADWLNSRCALQALLNVPPTSLQKDTHGKMLHPTAGYYLSLSHCNNLAIAISSKYPIGIDIQDFSPKLEWIAPKYIPTPQLERLQEQPRYLDYIHLHWGIKEALFKLWGKGQLDYRKHLIIEDFEIEAAGQTSAKIQQEDVTISCHINYEKAEDYYLCIAIQNY